MLKKKIEFKTISTYCPVSCHTSLIKYSYNSFEAFINFIAIHQIMLKAQITDFGIKTNQLGLNRVKEKAEFKTISTHCPIN